MGQICSIPEVETGAENSDDKVTLNSDREALENSKEITKEAFEKGMKKILNLAIEGYPRAVRSIAAKRNELLREYDGDQEKAVEYVKASAAAIKEEAKTWLIGLVPFVGFPASVLWPTWKLLRRVCLMAALYGHDVMNDLVKAKIVSVFGGLRAVPAGEYVLENAIQLVWVAFAGPIAGVIPVGTLVGKVTNAEGHLMGALAKETFTEGQTEVDRAVFEEELDPQPTLQDFQDLAKDGTQYMLLKAWDVGSDVVTIAWDEQKRAELIRTAGCHAKNAQAVGRGLIAAAPDLAVSISGEVQKGLAKGMDLLHNNSKKT